MVHPTARPASEPSRLSSETLRHLTQLDLARRWRISTKTLERWRWLGQGPGFLKLGGRVAYRLEEIERYEAAQLRGACGLRAEQRPTDGAAQHSPAPVAGLAASAGPRR
jgi:hypothetical protein